MKTIKPSEYKKLNDKEQFCYKPVYVGYKKKKVRDYSSCESCGHSEFMGWREVSIPIGEPLSYEKWKPGMMDWVAYDMARSLARSLDRPSFLRPDSGGEVINIPFVGKK